MRQFSKEEFQALTTDILDVLRKHNIPVYLENEDAVLDTLVSDFQITRLSPEGYAYRIPENVEIQIRIVGAPKLK